jgi:hypothetical protein
MRRRPFFSRAAEEAQSSTHTHTHTHTHHAQRALRASRYRPKSVRIAHATREREDLIKPLNPSFRRTPGQPETPSSPHPAPRARLISRGSLLLSTETGADAGASARAQRPRGLEQKHHHQGTGGRAPSAPRPAGRHGAGGASGQVQAGASGKPGLNVRAACAHGDNRETTAKTAPSTTTSNRASVASLSQSPSLIFSLGSRSQPYLRHCASVVSLQSLVRTIVDGGASARDPVRARRRPPPAQPAHT